MPSDDLVLGLPNLSAIQSSVSKMNVRPQRQQTDTEAGGADPAMKAEYSSSDSVDGASVSSTDVSAMQASEHSGLLSPALSDSNAYPPSTAVSVQDASAVVSTSSLPNLPPTLADLQNPATFSIQPSPKHGRKITKASFFDSSRPALGEAADASEGSADPLSKLDPLWSLKPTSKETTDGEPS